VLSSNGSPTFSAAFSAQTAFQTVPQCSPHNESLRRDARCPLLKIRAFTAVLVAVSRFALGITMKGSLPQLQHYFLDTLRRAIPTQYRLFTARKRCPSLAIAKSCHFLRANQQCLKRPSENRPGDNFMQRALGADEACLRAHVSRSARRCKTQTCQTEIPDGAFQTLLIGRRK